MQSLRSIHSAVFENIEKTILQLETQHESAIEQAYAIGEQTPLISAAVQTAKNIHIDWLHKSYRGTRDFSEMWKQAGDNLLALSPF